MTPEDLQKVITWLESYPLEDFIAGISLNPFYIHLSEEQFLESCPNYKTVERYTSIYPLELVSTSHSMNIFCLVKSENLHKYDEWEDYV